MRASVFFYRSLAPDSVLLASLRNLMAEYETRFVVGINAGFGATHLSWEEALTLATKITATVLKTDASSVFDEMRLLVQEDPPEKKSLSERFKIKADT